MIVNESDGNVEGCVSVGEANSGSKRKKEKVNVRNVKKKVRYSDPFVEPHGTFPQWQQVCAHQVTQNDDGTTTGGVFLCPLVSDEDVKLFRKNLFANKTKVDQDKFLLLNIASNPAVRKRVSQHDQKKKRTVSSEFSIRLAKGKRVRVCRKTFEEIVKPIGPTRITGITSRHFNTGLLPRETRGGDRVLDKNYAKKQNVRQFISKLKARESHYGRNKSVRLYLPSELNSCRNLHCIYNTQNEEPLQVSRSMFYEIFS